MSISSKRKTNHRSTSIANCWPSTHFQRQIHTVIWCSHGLPLRSHLCQYLSMPPRKTMVKSMPLWIYTKSVYWYIDDTFLLFKNLPQVKRFVLIWIQDIPIQSSRTKLNKTQNPSSERGRLTISVYRKHLLVRV